MDEISQGVRILVERCETNPDEMMEEYGKWSQLRNAVFDYIENRGNPDRHAWLRGLRDDEIKLLYDAFAANHRRIFDEYVMKNVLVEGEGEATEEQRRHAQALRGLVSQNPGIFKLAPNSVSPGGVYELSAAQTSNTSIATTLKNALGIK